MYFFTNALWLTLMPVQRNGTKGQLCHHRPSLMHTLVSVSPPRYPNSPETPCSSPRLHLRLNTGTIAVAITPYITIPLRSQTSKIEWRVSVKCETHSEYTISIMPAAGGINRKRVGGLKHCTTNMRNRAG